MLLPSLLTSFCSYVTNKGRKHELKPEEEEATGRATKAKDAVLHRTETTDF